MADALTEDGGKIHEMTNNTHRGWSNYETWCWNLHITNEGLISLFDFDVVSEGTVTFFITLKPQGARLKATRRSDAYT